MPTPTARTFTGVEGGQNQGTQPLQGQDFGNVVLRHDLSNPAADIISFSYTTVEGTATEAQNYDQPGNELALFRNETTIYQLFPVTDDAEFEGGQPEYFDIVLSDPSLPIFTGEKNVRAFIRDNEEPPVGIDYVDRTTQTDAEMRQRDSWITGRAVRGSIEHDGDADWYRTTMLGGYCYQIDIWGEATGEHEDVFGLTLTDPFLLGVFTSLGNYMEDTETDFGGWGEDVNKTVKSDQITTVYIAVTDGWYDGPGTFDLSLYRVGKWPENCTDMDPSATEAAASLTYGRWHTVSEPVGEDLAFDHRTKGYLQPWDEDATGNIDREDDADAFKIPMVAGKTYTIEMKGNYAAIHGGTLKDPVFVILDSFGERLEQTNPYLEVLNSDQSGAVSDSYSGEGLTAKLGVRAKKTETYLIGARGVVNRIGTYTLNVTQY